MLILFARYKLCTKKDVQYMQGSALPIRHIICTSEDVHYKESKSSGFGTGGTTQKYFPMNKFLLLLIY